MLIAAGVVAIAVSGCGQGDAKRDVRREAQGFYSAVDSKDGSAACDRLTVAVIEALEQQEKEACSKAVTSVDLKPSTVSQVRVYETSADVKFANGELAYLDLTNHGWKVSAAGCKPQGETPADCELED